MSGLEPGLSVFVPALNEETCIGPMIESLLAGLRANVERFEIIMIDDGSTDGTGRIMDGLAAGNPELVVIHNPRNLGIGGSFQKALGIVRYATFTDLPGDDSFDLLSMKAFWAATKDHPIVFGYRTNQKSMRTALRAGLSWLFNRVVNLLFGLRLRDIHGPVAFPVEKVRGLPLSYRGYTLQVEIIVNVLAGGPDYVEVPVSLKPDDATKSKALRLKTLWEVFRLLLSLFWSFRILPPARR